MEFRRIGKSGHSLNVTLPKPYLLALKLRHRDAIALDLVDGTIVISRAHSEREFTSIQAKGKGGTRG